jgi:hypothetical protein
VGIKAIKKAQIEAGARDIEAEDANNAQELSSILSHITIN